MKHLHKKIISEQQCRLQESQQKKTECLHNKRISTQNYRCDKRNSLSSNYRSAKIYNSDKDIQTFTLGEMSALCKYCNAKHFEAERSDDFPICCHKGKINENIAPALQIPIF